MRKTTFLITLAGLALAAACQRAPAPAPAVPQPTEAELALRRHVQDSLAAVSRATADSVARVRQAELAAQARADSIERVRLAAETAARDTAAEANATLRTELGVMVHFDVAEAQIQADGRDALDRKVAILTANPAVRLRITGACDERGSDQYNVALGERRAAAVKRYLMEKGIDVARLDEASVGELSPVDTGTGETAWARNRRAEFVIVSGDTPLAMK
jgi:peptidoglycan-associated lipoprotein